MNPAEEEHSLEEIKILLKKNLAISGENNRILHSLRNAARFHSFLRIVFLIIIIGGIFWGYRYAKPYFDQIKNTYSTYQSTQTKFLDTMNKFIPGGSQ